MTLPPSKKPNISKDRGKNIFLICRDTISSNKKGNLERNYTTKHGEDFAGIVGEARQIKLDQMKKSLTTEQSIFGKVMPKLCMLCH